MIAFLAVSLFFSLSISLASAHFLALHLDQLLICRLVKVFRPYVASHAVMAVTNSKEKKSLLPPYRIDRMRFLILFFYTIASAGHVFKLTW